MNLAILLPLLFGTPDPWAGLESKQAVAAPVSQDERSLATRVAEALDYFDAQGLTVETWADGTVRVRGRVASARLRTLLVGIVRRVRGVRRVMDGLTLDDSRFTDDPNEVPSKLLNTGTRQYTAPKEFCPTCPPGGG